VHLLLRGHCRIAALLCLWVVLIPHSCLAHVDDRPWMGMDIVDCRTESGGHGVGVVHVENDAPARDAGILPGDVVVAMNGLRLSGSDDFICRVSGLSVGQRLHLTVLRGGEVRFPTVRLGMWPLNIPQGRHSCPIQVSLADQPAARS
jgi:S1-C subfamily serine protease